MQGSRALGYSGSRVLSGQYALKTQLPWKVIKAEELEAIGNMLQSRFESKLRALRLQNACKSGVEAKFYLNPRCCCHRAVENSVFGGQESLHNQSQAHRAPPFKAAAKLIDRNSLMIQTLFQSEPRVSSVIISLNLSKRRDCCALHLYWSDITTATLCTE